MTAFERLEQDCESEASLRAAETARAYLKSTTKMGPRVPALPKLMNTN